MLTTANYFDAFETHLITARRLSPHSVSAYLSDLSQLCTFLETAYGITLITDARAEHLHGFIQSLFAELKAKSQARKISSLKTFFSFLSSTYGVENPTESLIAPKLDKTLPRFLTEPEMEQLFAAAADDRSPKGIRNAVMLHVLYATGLRVTELVTLRDDAIRPNEGFISVTGKGKKQRDIPVPVPILDFIMYYREHVRSELIGNRTSPYLFAALRDNEVKPLTRQAFWLILNRYVADAGITKEISPHVLRHSLATHLLTRGVHLRSIQMVLGHESVSTVTLYTHLETSGLRRMYAAKHPRA